MKEKREGIGVDLEDISRFRSLPFSQNKPFYHKIFTRNETRYCLRFSDPYPHFAVRFCAKEAFVKASNEKADFKKIEILGSSHGPKIKIHQNALRRRLKNAKIHLSLSHTKDYAVATVLIRPCLPLKSVAKVATSRLSKKSSREPFSKRRGDFGDCRPQNPARRSHPSS